MPSIDIEKVIAKVKDDSGRLNSYVDYQPAIDGAVEKYSKDRPREIVKDATGNGAHDLPLPAEWVEEFSQIRKVEYPVGKIPEVVLTSDRYTIYQSPAGAVLRLLDEMPDDGKPVRLTITIPRTGNMIVTGDMDAVENLAAANCCEILANLFVQTSDPTIAADVVNYRTKSAEFSSRAKQLRKLYQDHMGIKDEGGAPASMVAAAPKRDALTITHGWRA